MKNIQICIPKGRKLIEGFGISLMGVLMHDQKNPDYFYTMSIKEQPFIVDEFNNAKYKRIAEAREELVKDAINNNADYILFLDDDAVFPENSVERLFKLINSREDIGMVSGICFAKKPPYFPTMFTSVTTRDKDTGKIHVKYKHILNYENEVLEVDGVGLFLALVDVNAIKSLRTPYFSSPELDMASHIGEDISFSRRLWEADYEILVDTSIKCGHIYGDILVTESDFLKNIELAEELDNA